MAGQVNNVIHIRMRRMPDSIKLMARKRLLDAIGHMADEDGVVETLALLEAVIRGLHARKRNAR